MGELKSGTITLSVFQDMIKRYNDFVTRNNGQKPGKIFTVNGGQDYISLKCYGVMTSNYVQYQKVYGKKPNTIEITLTKKTYNTSTGTTTPTPIITSDIQKKIINGTGKSFSTFTEFYNLIKDKCEYAYYFNGQYNAANAVAMVIKDINGSATGLNCVDYAQLGIKLAKEMGYTAVPYGIWCSGDQINHAIFKISGKEFGTETWIDLAAAAKSSYSIGNHWCSGALTKEPSWIPYE